MPATGLEPPVMVMSASEPLASTPNEPVIGPSVALVHESLTVSAASAEPLVDPPQAARPTTVRVSAAARAAVRRAENM